MSHIQHQMSSSESWMNLNHRNDNRQEVGFKEKIPSLLLTIIIKPKNKNKTTFKRFKHFK